MSNFVVTSAFDSAMACLVYGYALDKFAEFIVPFKAASTIAF
jgi:hypothetical protein